MVARRRLADGPLDDPLPDDVRARRGLLPLRRGAALVHRPQDTTSDVARARERLRYDEAFVLQVVLAQRRAEPRRAAAPRRAARPRPGCSTRFDAAAAVRADRRAAGGVGGRSPTDLARDHPMHRLLQGEVGSGKTVVALRAMLAVVDAGGQAALLAPTEVLAQQHHRSITDAARPAGRARACSAAPTIGTRVALLTGSQSGGRRARRCSTSSAARPASSSAPTRCSRSTVEFADLGLVVVDEQHRFGVEQRDALARPRPTTPPHVLVMTATPIPRTVAMTVFGDLEVSTLTELPAGRSPITSHVVPAAEKPHCLERAWQRVREEVAAGHQAYVVCPRIGGDEPTADTDEAEAPTTTSRRRPAGRPLAVLDVAADAAPTARWPACGSTCCTAGCRRDDKDDVMRRFAAGEIDVLVATTVIEVGVDVPNATVDGRPGRRPVRRLPAAPAARPGRPRHRARAVPAGHRRRAGHARRASGWTRSPRPLDGFELSRLDLEHRREGDVLGAAQSGRRSSLRLLRVLRDEDVIATAREDAAAVVDADPTLAAHPALLAAVDAVLVADERADYLEKA